MSVIRCAVCERSVDTDFEPSGEINGAETCDECAFETRPDCASCMGTGLGLPGHDSKCGTCGGRGTTASAQELEEVA